MNGLEALNKIQHNFGQLKGQELVNCFETINKELKAFEILKEEFSIEAYESANGNKAISIYSDFDKYAVVKVVSQEKHDLIKEVLENEEL